LVEYVCNAIVSKISIEAVGLIVLIGFVVFFFPSESIFFVFFDLLSSVEADAVDLTVSGNSKFNGLFGSIEIYCTRNTFHAQ